MKKLTLIFFLFLSFGLFAQKSKKLDLLSTSNGYLFDISANKNLNSELLWTIEDQIFEVGDTVTAPFRVFFFDSIAAYQFAVQFDTITLSLTGLELPNPTSIPMANLNDSMFVDFTDTLLIPSCIMGDFGFCTYGQVRHVWSNPYSSSTGDNSLIFTLYFVANESGILSENLSKANFILNSVAYDFQLNYMPLNIVFVDDIKQPFTTTLSPEKEKTQLYPNPFNDFVMLGDSENNEVRIFGVDGELIYESQNINKLNTSFLQHGVYFFHLNGAIYKMIK